MTKLEAVNEVFMLCGQYPVAAIDTTGTGPSNFVEKYIDQEVRHLLNDGWAFNTRTNVTLTPDGSNHIAIPSSTLSVDTYGADAHRNVTVSPSASRLYDRDNNTDEFDGAITVTYLEVVAWDYLPQSFQRFALCSAARKYNREPDRARVIEMEWQRARTRAYQDDIDQRDINLLKTDEMQRFKGLRARDSQETF